MKLYYLFALASLPTLQSSLSAGDNLVVAIDHVTFASRVLADYEPVSEKVSFGGVGTVRDWKSRIGGTEASLSIGIYASNDLASKEFNLCRPQQELTPPGTYGDDSFFTGDSLIVLYKNVVIALIFEENDWIRTGRGNVPDASESERMDRLGTSLNAALRDSTVTRTGEIASLRLPVLTVHGVSKVIANDRILPDCYSVVVTPADPGTILFNRPHDSVYRLSDGRFEIITHREYDKAPLTITVAKKTGEVLIKSVEDLARESTQPVVTPHERSPMPQAIK